MNPLNNTVVPDHRDRPGRDPRRVIHRRRPLRRAGLARWLHILSGVMWIGLLYYFNVAQTPALAAAGGRQGRPGRRRHHQVRRAARPVLVSLGGGSDLAHRRLVPRSRRQLRAAR